jgi:hypothetical protein
MAIEGRPTRVVRVSIQEGKTATIEMRWRKRERRAWGKANDMITSMSELVAWGLMAEIDVWCSGWLVGWLVWGWMNMDDFMAKGWAALTPLWTPQCLNFGDLAFGHYNTIPVCSMPFYLLCYHSLLDQAWAHTKAWSHQVLHFSTLDLANLSVTQEHTRNQDHLLHMLVATIHFSADSRIVSYSFFFIFNHFLFYFQVHFCF